MLFRAPRKGAGVWEGSLPAAFLSGRLPRAEMAPILAQMRVRRSSIATLLVAIGLVGAQVVGLLHLVLVEHERCAEHGEMIEVRGEVQIHAHAQRPASPALAGARAAAVTAAETGSPAHDHEHCLVLLGRRTSGPPAPAAAIVASVGTSPIVVVSSSCVAAPRGPPLYRLAPKSSPPAA
jgi:hypothetical protein